MTAKSLKADCTPLITAHDVPALLPVCKRTGKRWDEKYASRLFAKVVAAAVIPFPGTVQHSKT